MSEFSRPLDLKAIAIARICSTSKEFEPFLSAKYKIIRQGSYSKANYHYTCLISNQT